MNDMNQPSEDPQTLVIDESQLAALRHKAVVEQHLVLGTLGGVIAGLIGAMVWAVITLKTGMRIGYVAIGVGFMVGYAIKVLGKGYTPVFGVVGALLACLACVVGNYFSVVGFVAQDNGMAFLDALKDTTFSTAFELMKADFALMDVVFYVIAIGAGWQYSFKHLTQEELNRL